MNNDRLLCQSIGFSELWRWFRILGINLFFSVISGAANRGALWMAKPEKVQFLHEHLSKTYCKFAENIKESMENPGE